MSEWQAKPIADLGRVVTGSTPPSRNPGWFGESTPFVTPSDMTAGDRKPRPERWLSDDGRAGLRTRLVPGGSVAFVCIGATIGKVCLLSTESVTNQQINTVIPSAGTDSRFLYYLLMHTAPTIAQAASGAATPIINKSAFSNVAVRVPDHATQSCIGQVLGGLDDLIENNRRRVEVLEEMARAIYREWFVKFRYPGHENVPLVESALGPIPEGWACVPLGRAADLDRTGLQPGKFPTEMFDHYSLPAFDRARLPALEVGAAIKSSKYVVSSPAVLVSKLNPRIDRTWYVEPGAARRSITSTEFLVLRPKEPHTLAWLYLLATSQPFRDRLVSLSGGTSTSHQRTKPQDLLEIEVVVSPESVPPGLTDVAAPLLSEARALVKEGDLLARLRDLLLPKLVTGQIDVSTLDLDALIEEQVAS